MSYANDDQESLYDSGALSSLRIVFVAWSEQ